MSAVLVPRLTPDEEDEADRAAIFAAHVAYRLMLRDLERRGELFDERADEDLAEELAKPENVRPLLMLVGVQTPDALPDDRVAMDARIGKHVRLLVERIVGNLADRKAGFIREALL